MVRANDNQIATVDRCKSGLGLAATLDQSGPRSWFEGKQRGPGAIQDFNEPEGAPVWGVLR